MDWLKVIVVFPVILDLVIRMVKEVETSAIPGEQKKELVLAAIKAGLDGLTICGINVPTTVVLTVAAGMVDSVVATYNVVGAFRRKE